MPQTTADQELVRKVNKSIILNTLRLHAPISRADLAVRTGLNRSTISNIINSLIEEGLVHETELQDSKVGRPAISLMLKPEGGAVIGVEIGVGFISLILTDFVANPLWRERIEIESTLPQLEILSEAERMIDRAMRMIAERGLRPLGIGVGLPGLVDIQQGELIFAPNLRWEHVPFRLMWNQRFRLPIYTENEGNAAALGEYYFGAARGADNMVYLSSGIGLGGGVIIRGKLFRGNNGFASEIGHMMMDPRGELCGCGRRGCWETQVSPRAVMRRVRQSVMMAPNSLVHSLTGGDLAHLKFQTVVEAARAGDPVCMQSLEDVAVNLGLGIANLVNIFNPELVVIGGALSLGQDMLMPVVEKTVFREALGPVVRKLRIVPSGHGADACVVGAVAMVLDDILREMEVI